MAKRPKRASSSTKTQNRSNRPGSKRLIRLAELDELQLEDYLDAVALTLTNRMVGVLGGPTRICPFSSVRFRAGFARSERSR